MIQEEMVESHSRHQQQAEIVEEAARAREYLKQLRPQQRRILELSITDGLSQSQIAEATNLPLGTVKTNLYRGLREMHKQLGGKPDAYL